MTPDEQAELIKRKLAVSTAKKHLAKYVREMKETSGPVKIGDISPAVEHAGLTRRVKKMSLHSDIRTKNAGWLIYYAVQDISGAEIAEEMAYYYED